MLVPIQEAGDTIKFCQNHKRTLPCKWINQKLELRYFGLLFPLYFVEAVMRHIIDIEIKVEYFIPMVGPSPPSVLSPLIQNWSWTWTDLYFQSLLASEIACPFRLLLPEKKDHLWLLDSSYCIQIIPSNKTKIVFYQDHLYLMHTICFSRKVH